MAKSNEGIGHKVYKPNTTKTFCDLLGCFLEARTGQWNCLVHRQDSSDDPTHLKNLIE